MRKRGQFPIQTPDGVMVPSQGDDACEVIRPEGETDRMQPAQNFVVRLNYRLLITLAALLVVSPLLIMGVHAFQMQRMGSALLERADQNEAEGNLVKAASNLAGYLRFKPDDIDTRIRMTLLLLESADTPAGKQNAYAQLSAVLAKVPGRDDLRRKRVDLLIGAPPYTEQNLTQAAYDLDVLIDNLREIGPDDETFDEVQQDLLELYLLRAVCFEILTDPNGAILAYRYAIRIDPGHVEARERLATLLSRQGERAEAEDVLKKLVQNRPDMAEAYAARAKFYLDAGNLQAAIRDGRTAYEKAPDDSDILLLVAAMISSESKSRGQIHSFEVQDVRENLENALQQVGDVPETDKNSADEIERQRAILIEALANLDLVSGQSEAAIRRLTDAINDSKDNVQFRWSLANILISQRRLQDAQVLLDDIDEQDLPGPLKSFLQARILEAKGEWQAAIDACDKIATNRTLQRMFPGGIEILRARCEGKLGHIKQELIAYQQAVNADSGSAEARIGLAGALARLGRVKEAESILKEAFSSTGVPLLLARIAIEKNLQLPPKQRDWAPAQQQLDIAASQGEDLVDVLILRAQVEQYIGNRKAARQFLEQAQQRYPDRIAPWVALADLEAQTGSPEKALQQLNEAELKFGWHLSIVQAQLSTLSMIDKNKARQFLEKLAKHHDDSTPRTAILQLTATAYEQLGDIDEALATWEEFSQLEPANFQAYLVQFQLALKALKLDRIQGDDGTLAKMAAIEGKNGDHVRLARAQLLIAKARRGDRQRLDQAKEILDDLRNRFILTDKVLASLADWEAIEGNQVEATDLYREAIAKGSTDPRVIRELVRRLNAESNFPEASAVIDQYRKNSRRPLNNELQFMATEALAFAGDYDQAIYVAMQSISPDSTNYQEQLWLASLLIAAEKTKEAEISLKTAWNLGRDHVETWVALLKFLKAEHRTTEIEKNIQQALQQFPSDKQPLQLANIYEAIDDIEAAEKYYRAAVALDPNNADLRISTAEFFNRIRKPQEAEPHLRHVLSDETKATTAEKATARRALALALAANGEYPKTQSALRLVEKNLAQEIQTTSDLRLKALLLARQSSRKNRRQALHIYRQLNEEGRLLPPDRMVLAKLLLTLGEWPQAKTILLQLMNDPACPPSDLAFGIRTLMNRSELDEVGKLIDKLAAKKADKLQTLELKARYLTALRKNDEAIALLDSAMQPVDDQTPIATKSQIALIYLGFAEFMDRTGRTVDVERFSDKSENYLRETMQDNPAQTLLLVRLLKLRGEYEQALELLNDSWTLAPPEQIAEASLGLLKKVPDSDKWISNFRKRLEAEIEKSTPSPQLLFQAANLAHLQQDYDTAIRWYRQALVSSPNSVNLLNELAVLLALNQRDLDEALELINRAIYLSGPNAMLLDSRAMIHLAMGNAKLAIDDLKLALEEDASPAKYYHMAQARELAGDQFAAKTAFRKARATGFSAAQLHPLEHSRFQELSSKLN
ncbi:tetratricopeptide repeat protein [Symmachiella macrocystis]|uniref:Tetratricopeptide repeat protein n=1 Tax=Symmachiella macrocystis TaxID=2527985 RepID=A0A5C6BHZ9_9PLAN|nr:tetratricopeptide repeat protein [Symmachiella macrocystis]TWU11327.1 tetratricopeptide repeat protein [Symmachiella macrocystis]